MALAPRLEIRQGQSLVMTPQLQQAIKLLQLSNIELSNFVEQELEKNPLLDRDERADIPDMAAESADRERADASGDTGADSGGDPSGDAGGDAGGDDGFSDADAGQLSLNDASPASEMDSGFEDMYPDDTGSDRTGAAGAEGDATPAALGGSDWSASGGSGAGGAAPDGDLDLESRLTRDQTLHEFLTEQLDVSVFDPAKRLIGRFLIDCVDDAGYLRFEDGIDGLADIADRLGVALEDVEGMLTVMQGFEPTGVMARSLKECMALQLAEQDRLDPAMQCFLDNLELVARRDLAQLCKLCGVDEEDIRDMIAEIRALDPRPGLTFGGETAAPVVPDVFVRAAQGGGWTVELNTETLPRVLVNQQYYATVSGATQNKDDKLYLSDCLQSANWLVKSLDQRARTILKVSREIVRQQDGFFAHGVSHLRPLNLKTIADAIDMHESTVSRVTSNKFMATSRGVFELKYFFTSAISSTDGGDAHSAEAVRHRIRELIDSESPKKILSDDKIVEMLKLSGIDIARRTVAKYREAMNIPSSVERRRQKKLSA
ncbi:RNA polymerase factor sigma-54 [Pyruvatibacter mobilis]|uniref:RNA polymerase sigma-54 factor n=1 Tax=Pyruvatibacter mobilis TaxID=1712261 RepID=A0A845Q8W9_9HYPH|nr:RNA polymerase factor sigma-54 [Pyruvatibacter mobilis]NBG94894.1 RNA polymerase factor sigma-54 [Pyruvatibacter mobilis]QJD76111.1 RNA polymerase factor sigma-54 [Pyruvatibacter mobilis]GGD21259.1 RNA polymerase sigma-54 factor [Pyruvatibacter mobilis]